MISDILEDMKRTVIQIQAFESEDGYFVASCGDPNLVTQGKDLKELEHNIREAVSLAFEDEDMDELGYVENPSIIVTLELASHA